MPDIMVNGHPNEKGSCGDDDPNIVVSPYSAFASQIKIPEIPLTDYLLQCLDMNYDLLKDLDWAADVVKGTSYKFRDLKPLSTKIASALTRLGFKKGDVLYYVTYDVALTYMIVFSVWRCGGAVRGCYQKEGKEEFERQMRETKTKFVMCDPETAEAVKWASARLDWPVHLLSIGKVDGAIDVEEMIEKEDGSAFPHNVKINPKEDVVAIPNTSGSTGLPKGVMHTHYNFIGMLKSWGRPEKIEESQRIIRNVVGLMLNYAVGSVMNIVNSIYMGFTFHSISKFDKSTFLDQLIKIKPESIFIFPYVANWLIRLPELDNYDLSFIKQIGVGGSVLDSAAANIIEKRLPSVTLIQVYASTEALTVASSILKVADSSSPDSQLIAGVKFKNFKEEVHVSCGPILPLVKAKIVDKDKGCSVGRLEPGTLFVKSPYLMKGYLSSKHEKGYTCEDVDGWLDTGDIGFFDEDGELYILDRRSFMFKYNMHHVSPAELETVVGEHPAVLSVGVIGVPDKETTYAARAYVVLKAGCTATEEEIKEFVADRKVFYKHLHGGVVFVDHLPESRGGKLDRPALLNMVVREQKSKGTTAAS
ncbi:4-coumarate--CoA ligase-like 1 [Ischnura elegans]|uniref:4-coumarate--CoA ligase-like 1 n=1 Tax=Ischnura elegans TaxID=197161 RepID=UPI001ED87466|nr:4-coumarate--CoA ligase-like 1 [Ischnura elegans]XP_046395104.1 4-coumarate--CoA ligase-like 1 [Ischnura elegans]